MNFLRHAVFALSYTLVASVAALSLPALAGLAGSTSLLFGLVIFALGALLQQYFSRQESEERLEQRLDRLQERVEQVGALVGKVADLRDPSASALEVRQVVSDARVLETLSQKMPAPRTPPRSVARTTPPAAAPAPAPAAPVAAPAESEARRTPSFGAAPPSADHQAMLATLQDALNLDRVDMFLQPIVSLPQRKHRYYEVFTRIRDEAGVHLTPNQYLAVAEQENLIGLVDNFLLFRCIQLLRESEKRHQNVGFFCNISAATLNDPAFMREFLPFLAQNQQLTSKLVFELTQADLMQQGVFQTSYLDGLRRIGFKFSMDQVDMLDLNPAELAKHEIRYVKIDAEHLLDPQGRFAKPESAQEFKRALDRNSIDLIAEKIETEQQLLDLLDLFIDFGQGYLFGEPRIAKRQG